MRFKSVFKISLCYDSSSFLFFSLAADLKCGGVVCDANANCSQPSSGEMRQCVCNPGWTGNGQTCLGIETFFLATFSDPSILF